MPARVIQKPGKMFLAGLVTLSAVGVTSLQWSQPKQASLATGMQTTKPAISRTANVSAGPTSILTMMERSKT